MVFQARPSSPRATRPCFGVILDDRFDLLGVFLPTTVGDFGGDHFTKGIEFNQTTAHHSCFPRFFLNDLYHEAWKAGF